jgi:hypothetical protein
MPQTEADIVSLIARIEPGMPVEQVAAAIDAVDIFIQRGKALREMLETAITEHIQATGQDLVIGTVRYYLAVKKDKKLRKDVTPDAVLSALFDKTGGDMAAVGTVLASGWCKPGAAEGVLGEDFLKYFEVVERESLEEGKSKKTLQKFDDRFARPGKGVADT